MSFPQARLVIIGDGPERERLQGLTTHLGLASCVSLLGYVPYAEIERASSRAWVQVVPSLWAEPFGRVAAEAMMRGTAVIASNSGGLAEIVQDAHSYFAAAGPAIGKKGALGDVQVLDLAPTFLHLMNERTPAQLVGRAIV